MNTKTYLEIHNLVFTFLSDNCKDLNPSKISELASKVADICDLKSVIYSGLKPSWSEAPSWANWLAMDKNGIWAWYEAKPKNGEEARSKYFIDENQCKVLGYEEISQTILEETLEQRPN